MRCVRNRSVVPALQLLKMEKEKKKINVRLHRRTFQQGESLPFDFR